MLEGDYPLPITPGVVAGREGVGEVVAVGESVRRVKVGERVAAAVFPQWIDGPFSFEYAAQLGSSLDGLLTEYAVLPESGVVPIPEHLSKRSVPSPAGAVSITSSMSQACSTSP
ncbi:alcohol dehydrogenase catalytic domain-containing protein [Kribbella sp. NPDC051620]|uniref:alcohol dehydrogenase catalytic domain-containing protein n=1 Tax=Kribbella sp. NPDC051620 TaxID=3364120 RepID=UPI0037AA66C7